MTAAWTDIDDHAVIRPVRAPHLALRPLSTANATIDFHRLRFFIAAHRTFIARSCLLVRNDCVLPTCITVINGKVRLGIFLLAEAFESETSCGLNSLHRLPVPL